MKNDKFVWEKGDVEIQEPKKEQVNKFNVKEKDLVITHQKKRGGDSWIAQITIRPWNLQTNRN